MKRQFTPVIPFSISMSRSFYPFPFDIMMFYTAYCTRLSLLIGPSTMLPTLLLFVHPAFNMNGVLWCRSCVGHRQRVAMHDKQTLSCRTKHRVQATARHYKRPCCAVRCVCRVCSFAQSGWSLSPSRFTSVRANQTLYFALSHASITLFLSFFVGAEGRSVKSQPNL